MPDAIAHYKFLGPLGSGGLGDVYRARDTNLGRTVAVKIIPRTISSDPSKWQQLLDAVQRLTELSHPNIAALFEIGQEGEQRFLVFEYVQGDPLSALVNGRALNVRRALEFAINLADALAYAHSLEVVHGDIRPDTIMITPKDRAKFMNFGLWRFTGAGASVQNSLPYVSPEEIAGGEPDPRSDIYSLGAVIFEMLTGRQRVRGLVLSTMNRNVAPELDQIIGRMLASNVEHRAQSAAVVAAELRAVAAILDTQTAAAEAASEPPRMRRRSGRARGLVILATIVLLGAAAAWLLL